MDFDIHLDGAWHPCASVNLLSEQEQSRNARVRVRYEADYAVERLGANDRNWRWLEDRLRAFAVKLDGLPAVMSECGVASGIIQQRRHEIESLADELRALKDR